MALLVVDDCIGCGACEVACPQDAIAQGDDFLVVYVIDPLLCNDCRDCVAICAVDALQPDPAWAVCHGRGCPLSSRRYADWECTEGRARCAMCGSMLWRAPCGTWECSRCRLGELGRGASCPKVRTDQAALR